MAKSFAIEYLPGQYDQRADSAAQCIKLIVPKAEPVVKFARVIVLEGDVSESEVEKIAQYCINPVDSQFALQEKPEVLDMDMAQPQDVPVVEGFILMTQEELKAYKEEMGFAMSDDDIFFIQDHFKKEKREIRP